MVGIRWRGGENFFGCTICERVHVVCVLSEVFRGTERLTLNRGGVLVSTGCWRVSGM